MLVGIILLLRHQSHQHVPAIVWLRPQKSIQEGLGILGLQGLQFFADLLDAVDEEEQHIVCQGDGLRVVEECQQDD